MKKNLLFFICLFSVLFTNAQNLSKDAALQLVAKNNAAIGLSNEDVSNSIISSAYHNTSSATDLVYLQQSFRGLPVFNQIQTLAFKNGKLVSSAGERIRSIEKLSQSASSIPAISAENAVRTAMADKKIINNVTLLPINDISSKKITFGKPGGVVSENITAELMWTPINEGKSVKLTWQVYLVPATTSDYWLIRIDANSNKVIDESNLTVYCNWGNTNHTHNATACSDEKENSTKNYIEDPAIVNSATYRVVPYPAESPIAPGGAHALITSPWTTAPGNATSLKWHSDGTTDWDYTRGNNVWAYHDRTNANAGDPSRSAQSSTTPDPLTFDFVPDYLQAPTLTTPPNQQFNITNLFYWNNIIHDLTYLYGFDEAGGNFQVNNQGRGGVGNDYVRAEAQDGSGTNNANFSTPADGALPRMQMYLWNLNGATINKDGDVDNGIIVHEYGHGISNRLTGGPSTASCLGNAEQMGEGWSDYYGLMYTQNWATSTLSTGFTTPRGIGLYALNGGNLFAGSAPGTGIRHFKYSTDFNVNSQVYLPALSTSPHDRGEIWCSVLWDMTWNIINQVGSINPNMFNPAGGGGNTIALKLVTEGMKLQPCSPGFIDGRNAILKADTLLFGAQYSCSIIEAFAKRGMGVNASQGLSTSVSDQVVDYTGGLTFKFTQNVTQIPEGQNIVYTHTVSSPCTPVVNYIIRDTLPLNVTYVSGGTYDAGTRVASFAVNLATGQTQTYVLTVNVNPGSYFPPLVLLDEQLVNPGPALPAGWNATSTTAAVWTVHNLRSTSAPNSFFTPNLASVSDQILGTTADIALGATPPEMTFAHWYNSEPSFDGGVVEISTNAGTTWTDLGANITLNGYNGTLNPTAGHPLQGRPAFNGNSAGFINTKINLASFANQNARFRFRFCSDVSVQNVGWNIDDIIIKKTAVVNMRSSFFNNLDARVIFKDTVTVILPSVGCTNVAITTQPSNTNACSGANATFSVAVTGTTPSYQWQLSTDAGVTWNNIAAANAANLTITAVTTGMNNNQYRVLVNNVCPSTATSTAASLTVTNAAAISTQPVSAIVCAGNNTSFTVTASGSSLSYQWQLSTDGGTIWNNITLATASVLNLTAVTAAMSTNQYRVVVFSCGPAGLNSLAATLTVNNPVSITAQPTSTAVCEGGNVSFTTTATGTAAAYQWQLSTDGGTIWSNITGATNTSITLTAVTVAMNNNRYRANITGTCTPAGINSAEAVLTVNSLVTISSQPAAIAVCAGLNTSFGITAAGTGLTHQWQLSTDGGTTWTNIAGATSATLTLTAVTTAMNNNRYRDVLNGTCTTNLNSLAALLTVNTPVNITAQPVNKAVCRGSNTSFTVAATGTTITYQWQVSINGGAFINLSNTAIYSGVTTSTLSITSAVISMNGYSYRVIVSGVPCGAVNSSSVVLTVNELPGVVLAASEYNRLVPSLKTTLFTTISPVGTYSYQWFKNAFAVSGASSANLPLDVDGFGEYAVIVTDVNGCSVTSNRVTISDSISNKLFIYPNPSAGLFQVRYYSPTNTTLGRTINVYDAKGARVYTQLYTIARPYDRMNVNLTNMQSGVYMVELKDAKGKRIASGMVVIQ